MKHSLFTSLLSVILCFILICPVFAEQDRQLSEEAPLLVETPVLIDRINNKKEDSGFAFAENDPLFQIVFPQILNCDAALLLCGDEAVLIDCASQQQANRVVNLLKQMNVTKLKYLINTHPHYDHLLGFETIAKEFEVEKLLICFPEDANERMLVAMKAAEELNVPVEHYRDEDTFTVGDAVLTMWLKGDGDWSMNSASAQILVSYGKRTVLMTADGTATTESRLVEVIPPELLDIDILKYPHHGLAALKNEFLDATTPLFAVITNNGGTTTPKSCLRSHGVAFAYTVPGYVSLTTDGTTWLAERLEMEVPVTVTSRPDVRKNK